MDVKQLLLQRGEWLALAIVFLFAVLTVFLVYSDEASKPKADAALISDQFRTIEAATNRPAPRPEPRQPQNSLAALRARMAVGAETPALVQWLSAHPNFIKTDGGGKYPYAFRCGVPKLAVESDMGTYGLLIQVPAATSERRLSGYGRREASNRLGGPGAAQWTRSVVGFGEVKNHVRPVAIQVQVLIGGGEYRPLSSIGDQGVVMLSSESDERRIELTDIQAMQEYQFRSRLLYAATAMLDQEDPMGNDVVMYTRINEADLEWRTFAQRWRNLGVLAEPMQPVPTAVPLREREILFQGRWSEAVAVESEPDILVGLKSVSTGMNGTQARFLVRKLLRDLDNVPLGWTPADRRAEFKVAEGEEIGEKVVMRVPEIAADKDIEVDLRTGFRLKELIEAERIEYYEIKETRLENGERCLEVRPKTDQSFVAVLENVDLGKEIRLLRLETIRYFANRIVYPQPPENPYREFTGLAADDPSAYQSAVLKPTAPIEHAPDDPLLREHEPTADTNVPYYELADGRLVYYDRINTQMYVVQMAPPVDEESETDQAEGDDAEATSQE
jgi:hypothetical protein